MALQRFTEEQAKAINAIHTSFANNELRLYNQNKDAVDSGMAGNAAQSLPKDFFGQWATEGIEVQRQALVIGSALGEFSRAIDPGLYADYFLTVSDSGDVNKSIDGQSQAKGDQAQFEYHGVPIGITDSTAVFGWKQFRAAQNKGFGLSTPSIANNQRKVAESLESDILNGSGLKFGDAVGYGLRNHPNRNRVATGVELQTLDGKGAKAVGVKCIASLHAAKYYDRIKLFMNYADWYYMKTTDYSDQYPNKSVLDGLMEALPMGSEIVPTDSIEVDELIGITMRRDVYEILNAMPMSTVPTVRNGVMDPYEYRVIASQAIELKFDANGNAGYFHCKKTLPAK